ncbi:GIY-YIG nuclease family protein [bacterium]|nr:GIY-YIG nuclease family protein [bacterium]
MSTNSYAVYILASKRNGTLYVGMTSDINRRMNEHYRAEKKGFTQKYYAHRLVHCEFFEDVREAINREKQLKKWRRKWKLELIEKDNPNWEDLSGMLF